MPPSRSLTSCSSRHSRWRTGCRSARRRRCGRPAPGRTARSAPAPARRVPRGQQRRERSADVSSHSSLSSIVDRSSPSGSPVIASGSYPASWPVCPRIARASMRERPQPQLLLARSPTAAPGRAARRSGKTRSGRRRSSARGARSSRSTAGCRASAGSWLRKIGSIVMKAAPRNAPRIEPSPPMMIMNSTWNERLIEGERLPRAEMTNAHSAPATPMIERADRESRQLGLQRADADDLGGDVHVADRHPHAADAAAHDVLGGERDHAQRAPAQADSSCRACRS